MVQCTEPRTFPQPAREASSQPTLPTAGSLPSTENPQSELTDESTEESKVTDTKLSESQGEEEGSS